jgi:NADH:ubiquinone reductase (H+-translocating)
VTTHPHVVILGGGFGGLEAARRLKSAPVRITLVDSHNHHLFQPLLYQVATAALSPGDIASPIRWILRQQRNTQVLLAGARSIDVEKRKVFLERAELDYDYLIVATGATHAYFGHDEWAQAAPGLKTLDDALNIRRRVLLAFEAAEMESDPAVQRRLLTFIIVGGGPTGVELAGALAEIARHALAQEFRSINPGTARIVLVEAGSSILSAFPEKLRLAAEQSLSRLCVEVRKNTAVTQISEDAVQLGSERFEAGTILWAAGVAASPLGKSLGVPLDRAGRVVVEPSLAIPEHPEVFVIGDLAAFTHQGGKPLPGTAPVAKQQGRHAAENIRRMLGGAPSLPFRYLDRGNMATIGRGAGIADFGWLRISGAPAWLAWLFVHILFLIGFRNRLVVMIQWAWAYVSYQRNVRLITGVNPR